MNTIIVTQEMIEEIEIIEGDEDDYTLKVVNPNGTITLSWVIPYFLSDNTDDYFNYTMSWTGKEADGWHKGEWSYSVSAGDTVEIIMASMDAKTLSIPHPDNTLESFIEDSIKEIAKDGTFPDAPYSHRVESASDYYDSSALRELACSVYQIISMFDEDEDEDVKHALKEELLEKYLPENLREHVALCRELALREALENKKVVEEARNKNKAERENPKTNIEPSSIIKPK